MKTYREIVDQAKARIQEVSTDEVRAMTERGAPVTIVDVREDSEWSKGHLPGALHVSRGVLEYRADRELPDRDATIVLYCGGGGRSALGADALKEMGYTDVRSMAGGFRAWAAAGNPTESE